MAATHRSGDLEMVVPLLVAAILLLAANFCIAIIALNRQSAGSVADVRAQADAHVEAADLLRSELRAAREEAAQAARDLRQEVSGTQKAGTRDPRQDDLRDR